MRMIYKQPDSFTINIMGECQFSAEDKRQLCAASRIGFWGCWLVFEKCSPSTIETINIPFLKKLLAKLTFNRYFIFKTSLSPQQFSRVCRIILKLNNTAKS